MPRISRNLTIVGSVLLLHVLVLWAMQNGLLRRVAQVVVPEVILVEIMAAPTTAPAPAPAPQPKLQAKAPVPQLAQPQPAPTSTVTPQTSPAPLAIAPSATSPAATSAAPTNLKSLESISNPNAGLAARTPAANKVQDSSCINADHLYKPKPPYPQLSKRLGEEGTTVLRILVGADGLPKKIELEKTSEFHRLDAAALEAVKTWRFIPCKIDGVPSDMWFYQPIPWQLTN